MIVYLDGIIGLNFLVDFLLLLGVNRLSGHPPSAGRAAAAAAVGGSYAGACMIPALAFLSSSVWRWISLGLISMTAFGINRSAVRRGILFILLSMALGGLVVSFGTQNHWGLGLSALGLGLLCYIGFQGNAQPRKLLNVTICYAGKEVKLLALVDTGNTLRDSVSGEPVLVTGPEAAYSLTELTPAQLADPVTALYTSGISGLRLISYHGVGTEGLLLALRCDSVQIGKSVGSRLVAFAPQPFPGGEYQALTGGQYE